MGTTIDVGTTFSSVTTNKPRFTKGPEVVTEGTQITQSDQFVLTAPAAPAASAAPQTLRFRDLDPASRTSYKDTVKSLASDGRLYVPDNGGLRRADPMEIKERLDQGLPVQVVSRIASESSSSSAYSGASSSKQRGVFSAGWNIANESHSSSASERVFYTSSPVTAWDSLDFASDGEGVKGVALLAGSGNSVVVSSRYESEWSSRADRQWGFFNTQETSSAAGAHLRTEFKAD